MKKTKTQKGITLIALIITIVVLLILAVVAINSIVNTDLIAHAENAAKTYNNSVKNEADILAGYLGHLCDHEWGEYVVKTAASCVNQTNEVKERTCTKCGTKETQTTPWAHSYDNDHGNANCTVCGLECQHDGGTTELVDGSIEVGKIDGFHYHSFFTQCNICNYYVSAIGPDTACVSYLGADGKCSVCGGENIHDWNEEGTCYYCGTTCTHATFIDGACTACGYGCEHTNGFTDNICNDCNFFCEHEFKSYQEDRFDNSCTVCGYECPHESATYDDMMLFWYCSTCNTEFTK